MIEESFHQRCQRLCGSRTDRCFVNNAGQLTCISDMLINKAYGLGALLELVKSEDIPPAAREMLDESIVITEELLNWVKYLQITRDLKNTAISSLPAPEDEKRKLTRFPFPEEFSSSIKLFLDSGESEMSECKLLNFSKKGLQLATDVQLRSGDIIKAQLVAVIVGRTVDLKAEVKYAIEKKGTYVAGVEIREVSAQTDFDFFYNVLEYIKESILPQPEQ